MTAAIALVILLAGLVWLVPLFSDPMGVLFWRGGAYSDLLITHWPNAAFVRHSLIQWGEVPLWNPMILSGAPFAADPLSGLYYPPNWLAIAINPGVAFNVLTWLHIAWGGLGMWRFGRALGISNGSAVVAGLAFAGMPKLIGHIGLGHTSLVFAVYWTPWVLLAFHRAIDRMNARSAALAGAVLGLVFLIDPRWYLPLALLSGAFVIWSFAHSHRLPKEAKRLEPRKGQSERAEGGIIRSPELAVDTDSSVRGDQVSIVPEDSAEQRSPQRKSRRSWVRAASLLVIAGLMSLAIAAILAAPMGEFVSLSTRADLSLAQSTALSLPPENLLNLLAPEYAEWPEWQIYMGASVLFLALLTLLGRAPGRWFWVGVVAATLIIALGDLTPMYGLLSALVPGFGQLRVPPRSLFVSAVAMAILAGMGLDQIFLGKVNPRQLRILGAVLAGIALLLALVFWFLNQSVLQSLAYVITAALIGISTLWAGGSARRPARWTVVGWCLLIVLDLSLVNLTTVEARPVPDLKDDWAPPGIDGSRIFSPSYSLPQPAAAVAGIELADGINPLQMASYVDYMSQATGFTSEEYSVTLPPFPEADPQVNWGFEPDLALMGNLAISQVVSEYRIPNTGLELERQEQGRYYYTNPQARPRSWVEGGESAKVLDWSPNRILIRASGPGLLVLSEIMYPGWQVEVDGKPVSLEAYEGLLRAVQLGAGGHEVEFTFQSNSLRAGLLITLLGLLILGSLWIRR